MQKMEKLYCMLLDQHYQERLFCDLPYFQKKGEGYAAGCPFHRDELPSLLIAEQQPSYFCFICSAGGDWIDYLMKIRKLGFVQALGELETAAGEQTGLTQDAWNAEHMRTQLLEIAHRYFQAMLFAPEGKQTFEYLEKRGYIKDEIEDMGLGFFPGKAATQEFFRTNGIGVLDVTDIFSDQPLDEYSIVIPYRDASGRLMGLMGKKASDGPDTYQPLTDMRYLQDTPLLTWRARGKKRMVVVDGLFDCLVAERVGITNVVGISKKGLSQGQLETLLQCGLEHIVLALSSHEAVQAAVELVSGQKKDIEISVVELPEGYPDVDAYIRSNCIHKFGDLVNRAISAQEWMDKHTR